MWYADNLAITIDGIRQSAQVTMTIEIPSTATIDEKFLTGLLQRAGHHTAVVKGVRQATIGTGQMGKCVRFELSFQDKDTDAPRSLVAKFPSDHADSRAAAARSNAYLREVIFYRDLAPGLNITTPRCYFADVGEDDQIFALVMADMAPAQQGDQLAGCTPELAALAVEELAGLHAPTWNNKEFFSRSPLLSRTQAQRDAAKTRYIQCLPLFEERLGPHLKPEQLDLFLKLGESAWFNLEMPVIAMTHGDFRLDNLLIHPSADKPITVVDWQTYNVGNPLSDVTYFLSTSLPPADRRANAEEIVKHYHHKLVEAGIEISWEACWTEYRRAACAGFLITVIASVTVQQTKRGDLMFRLMADRISQQALDLNAMEMLN